MTVAAPDAPVGSSAPPRPRPRLVAAVLSALLLGIGCLLVVAGGVTLAANAMVRDGNGYLMDDAVAWRSPGYAVQTRTVLVHGGAVSFTVPHRMLGRLHARAIPTGDQGVFIGIGAAAEVRRYLRGVARTTLSDPYAEPSSARFVDGGSPPLAPADAGFWVASSAGTEPQSVTWDPRPGAWRLVVMNDEGTTPVAADVAVGAEVPALRAAGRALVAVGLVAVVAGAALLGTRPRPEPNHPINNRSRT